MTPSETKESYADCSSVLKELYEISLLPAKYVFAFDFHSSRML